MEQHEEPKGSAYPRGRGYGQDYMRGGEVFGGTATVTALSTNVRGGKNAG